MAGKPEPPLFEETVCRVGGERPLVVGDRLDTDIEGATAVGVDSLLVMTGVTDLAVLAAAPSPGGARRTSRPTLPGCSGRTRPGGPRATASTSAAGSAGSPTAG